MYNHSHIKLSETLLRKRNSSRRDTFGDKNLKKQKLIKIFLDAIVIAFVLFIVPQIRKMSSSANVGSGAFVLLTALIAIIICRMILIQ